MDECKPLVPGFFFPQGFMTGVLQTHARKYAMPIDSLNFDFNVLDGKETAADIEEGPEDGVLIDGLFVDNARWNREARYLDESEHGQMQSNLPVILFNPVQHKKAGPPPPPPPHVTPASPHSRLTSLPPHLTPASPHSRLTSLPPHVTPASPHSCLTSLPPHLTPASRHSRSGLGDSCSRVQEYGRFGPNPTLHRIVRIFESPTQL